MSKDISGTASPKRPSGMTRWMLRTAGAAHALDSRIPCPWYEGLRELPQEDVA